MGTQHADARIKEMQIEAVVTRADGTKEDLGVIASYHRNPLKRLAFRLLKKALS